MGYLLPLSLSIDVYSDGGDATTTEYVCGSLLYVKGVENVDTTISTRHQMEMKTVSDLVRITSVSSFQLLDVWYVSWSDGT